MKTMNNTILITGGATGIGLALAEVFMRTDNQVIICGRRQEKLREAQKHLPALHTRECDVAQADQRQSLFDWVSATFPDLNILINNAGVQKQIDFTQGISRPSSAEDEIAINFTAPVLLSAQYIPLLMKQPEAAIVNVSSGLGFVPLAILPVYCATKAALHSFSLSLRHQLRSTSIKVFELIPPTVDTELDRGARARRNQEYRGIPAREVAEATAAGLARNEFEITVGQSQDLRNRTPMEVEQIFQRMNGNW